MAKKRKKHHTINPVKQEILNITRPPATRKSIPSSEMLQNALHKIDNLRFKYSYNNLNKIYDGLPNVYTDHIYNRNIAKTLKDVGRGSFGFETNEDNFEQQLNWFTLITLRHSKEINEFLKNKHEFEYRFLHGDYGNAEDIVNNVSESISYSFWGILNTWLLKEYAYTIEDKIKYLSKLGSENTNSLTYYLFTIYFSRIVESDIIIERYLDKINLEVYNSLKIDDKPIRYFIESYLNPNKAFFSEYSPHGILFGDEESSIIDIYINLQKIILNNILLDKKDMSIIINRLLDEINDRKLQNMKLLITDDIQITVEDDERNSKYFELLDNFTSGKYTISRDQAKSFLVNYPDSINVCEIYIKSHIYLGSTLEFIGKENSILNKILQNIFDIFLKNDKTESALVELNHLSFNLSSFDISKQLIYFVTEHTMQSGLELYRGVSTMFSPNMTLAYMDLLSGNKKAYLIDLKKISSNNNLTINFFEKLLDFENNLTEIVDIDIPGYRINIYKARTYFRKKMYIEVVDTINSIILEIKEFPHLLSEVLSLLYMSNEKLKDLDNCIILYVKYFFENKNLINYISINSIIPLISEKKFKNISHSIELPIFFHMSKAKEYLLFTSYRIFMKNEKLKRPSDIDYEQYPLKYIIYFLKHICTQKVLCTDVLNFTSQVSLDNERVSVCQLLAKIDKENAKTYNNEIVEITQNNKIKERMSEIDNSKIYVDNQGVITYDLKDFHNHFIRYKKTFYSLMTHQEELKFLSLDGTGNDLENNVQTSKNYISSKEQLQKMFIELFFIIRDAYLFSNGHGLDYYLSTRIRHGIIEGQLRKPFSNDKLITVKDSQTKEYKNNISLIADLDIYEDDKEELYIIFKIFSKNIDELITDIKNEYIHIKTENLATKENGFFDFSISHWLPSLQQIFKKVFMEIESNEIFIDEALKYCNFMTNHNLSRIRRLFDQEIKKGFILYLDSLEKELKELSYINKLNNLLSSIAHCKTDIQKEIDIISSWFEQKEKISKDFEVTDAIDTSIEIIKNIFPTVQLNFNKNINSPSLIKGKLFSHFVDCFKIFLENCVDYSKSQNLVECNISISISILENNIICKICNTVPEDTDFESLSYKIISQNENISKNLNTSKMREDKNSGLMKANNMIKKVIGNSDNYLNINLIEDTVCVEFNFNLERCT